MISLRTDQANLIAVRDAESFSVMWGNKADAFARCLYVPVQPHLFVAEDIEIVIANGRIEPQQVGVVAGADAECILGGVIAGHGTLRLGAAIGYHPATTGEDAVVIRIVPQCVDNLV